MEATTYTVGDTRVSIDRDRIAGVLVVHEVHHVRQQKRKEVWYLDGAELLRVKDAERSPFRKECRTEAEVRRLAHKLNWTA